MSQAIIDCRPWDIYIQGHIQGATSLPATQLFERMHELPKRNQALVLCGDAGSLALAQAFLEQRGYQIIEQIQWSANYEQQLKQHNQWEVGTSSRQLWRAAPFFQAFTQTLMPQFDIQAGRGLDIGCGAGRDMIYLAQHGWQMTGIDHHEDALKRAQSLATIQGVRIETQQLDLEIETDPFVMYPDASFDLVCVARYLHRPLFPFIKRLLAPQGVILFQTFLEGCGKPKNPNYWLKQGELADVFSDFEVLLDAVEYLEDGRPVSKFLARKKI